MRCKQVLKVGLSLAAVLQIVAATEARAVPPNASLSPDTDAFRTAGAAAVIDAQKTAIVSQFQEITRVFRGCITGGAVVADGSGCADGVERSLERLLRDPGQRCGTRRPIRTGSAFRTARRSVK